MKMKSNNQSYVHKWMIKLYNYYFTVLARNTWRKEVISWLRNLFGFYTLPSLLASLLLWCIQSKKWSTNSMHQSWELDCCSAAPEIPCLLWNFKVHNDVHKSCHWTLPWGSLIQSDILTLVPFTILYPHTYV